MGGLGLLALLAVQAQAYRRAPLALSPGLTCGAWWVAVIGVGQIALGGWVSTNYAVLACSDFPTCQGAWWPPMDFEHAFTVRRELGMGAGGQAIPFAALTAIHVVHRIGALVTLAAIVLLAWRLIAEGGAVSRRFALGLLAVAVWQFLTGLSNAVLGWPLLGGGNGGRKENSKEEGGGQGCFYARCFYGRFHGLLPGAHILRPGTGNPEQFTLPSSLFSVRVQIRCPVRTRTGHRAGSVNRS